MIAATAFAGKRVAVLGLGRSGHSAVSALTAGGSRVVAWDDDATRRREAEAAGIAIADLSSVDFSGFTALVPSPGVPLHHPEPHQIVRLARAAGCEILGDVELFARTCPRATVVAITGTNGKSTTTALAAEALRASGRTVAAGGNLGRPVLDLPPLAAQDGYVLELSSYQIDLISTLSADVAVLLNLGLDHLDRHGAHAGYVAAKKRLFRLQRPDQVAVVGVDDESSRGLFDELTAAGRRVVPISGVGRVDGGIYVERGALTDATGGTLRALADLRSAKLEGTHNWQNMAAAFAVARACGDVGPRAVETLLRFPGLPHRLERVAEVDGVSFVNDSKATNAEAAAHALSSYRHVYWIAGGRPKEQGIESLAPLRPRIRGAFLIGEAAEAFGRALKGIVPVTRCGTLDRAVAAAYAAARAEAEPDAVVLLSPACASFDQFRDFEARGDAFRALARRLEAT